MIKIISYGVRDVEVPFFHKLNNYKYEIKLIRDFLTHENMDLAKGAEAVIVRANCLCDRKTLTYFKENGIKYILARTVGYDYIDLNAAKELDLKVARVPSYSPNAIGELALTLAMMLLRNTAYMVSRTSKKNFIIDTSMFSREIRNCTVGIIGTGKIGLTAAGLFKGLGARVIGFDPYKNEDAKDILEYVEMDDLLKEADIISLHCPYIKDKNHHLVNSDFISKMKTNSILINTARGELVDITSVIEFIENGKLAGFGTDVLEEEGKFFFKNMEGKEIETNNVERLISLYPKVLITPHIGSYTDEALTNMIEISYANLQDFLKVIKCINEIKLS